MNTSSALAPQVGIVLWSVTVWDWDNMVPLESIVCWDGYTDTVRKVILITIWLDECFRWMEALNKTLATTLYDFVTYCTNFPDQPIYLILFKLVQITSQVIQIVESFWWKSIHSPCKIFLTPCLHFHDLMHSCLNPRLTVIPWFTQCLLFMSKAKSQGSQ